MYRQSWIAIAGVALLLLTGCAPEAANSVPGANKGTANDSTATESATPPASDAPAAPAKQQPREQAEDCGWDAPVLTSAALPGGPTGQDGELQDVIVGSWQHTHYDTGGGYEPIENKDIRYVFPSSERLLYCQHVPGITDYAQNAASFTWDGSTIALPGSAPGYIVAEWNDDTMVWINRLDDSRYLLQRR